jgi:hypothetical protein
MLVDGLGRRSATCVDFDVGLIHEAAVYPRVLDELIPAAWHHVERYANNRIEAAPATASTSNLPTGTPEVRARPHSAN